MIKYYDANIKVTEASAEQITINTMGQSTGELKQKWLEERRKRITASSVGLIAKRKPTTKVAGKVKQLLYSNFMETGLQIGAYFKRMLVGQNT